MPSDDDRKMLADKALERMRWTISNVTADRYVHQISPLDKTEFVKLLKHNFDRLDKNKDKGISKDEILTALIDVPDLTVDEHVMLQLLLRYFDFIADLVDDDEGHTKVVSKQDVEVLAQFLLNSNLTLEDLYRWCNTAPDDSQISPPPLTSKDPHG
jgi:hypothetical protein